MNTQALFKISNQLKIIATIVFTLMTSILTAQSLQTEVEIIQEAFGLDKKVVVANFMALDESTEEFWNIYDSYEFERKKIGKERIQVIMEYAEGYPDISDDKIIELFNRTQSVKKSYDKLMKTYFKKMRKEMGVQKAAQFWQIETYFSSLIQANIYLQIPFIGENTQGK